MSNTKRRTRFIIGGIVILLSLGYLIYAGLEDTLVYFLTPAELQAKGNEAVGQRLRLGGMVVKDSVHWDPQTLQLEFQLTDGEATIPVRHRGTPPDLFGEGRGAVVEGTFTAEGIFQAKTILAKHSEEYKAGEGTASAKERFRTLIKE
ncbi:MAG: cytochrome c maturation protein CcmE [Nitrospinota bacterium]|nr:MAG: cytochrome c maturation protein CcmE [Nitrospinota bacterium]